MCSASCHRSRHSLAIGQDILVHKIGLQRLLQLTHQVKVLGNDGDGLVGLIAECNLRHIVGIGIAVIIAGVALGGVKE